MSRRPVAATSCRRVIFDRPEEMRHPSRLRTLAALMASAGVLGGKRRLAAEDAAVRRRWMRLRRAMRG